MLRGRVRIARHGALRSAVLSARQCVGANAYADALTHLRAARSWAKDTRHVHPIEKGLSLAQSQTWVVEARQATETEQFDEAAELLDEAARAARGDRLILQEIAAVREQRSDAVSAQRVRLRRRRIIKRVLRRGAVVVGALLLGGGLSYLAVPWLQRQIPKTPAVSQRPSAGPSATMSAPGVTALPRATQTAGPSPSSVPSAIVWTAPRPSKSGDAVPTPARESGPTPEPSDVSEPTKGPGIPTRRTVKIGGGIMMDMIFVPAGSFMMGSRLTAADTAARYGGSEESYTDEQPHHRVRINSPFYVGRHEVTVAQFKRFLEESDHLMDGQKGGTVHRNGALTVDENVSWDSPGFEQSDAHPVVLVSWDDAVAFCKWLGRKDSRTYRLPTEAEWEYACRAGSDAVFWWGSEVDRTGETGNVNDPKRSDEVEEADRATTRNVATRTAAVGQYTANHLGLHDMIGNVREWCADAYGPYSPQLDAEPTVVPHAQARAIRGSAWCDDARESRSANRFHGDPGSRHDCVGFRVLTPATPGEGGGSVGMGAK